MTRTQFSLVMERVLWWFREKGRIRVHWGNGGWALEEEGFEGMMGLDRQKHKCSTGTSVMLSGRWGCPSEKALETKLRGWVFI